VTRLSHSLDACRYQRRLASVVFTLNMLSGPNDIRPGLDR